MIKIVFPYDGYENLGIGYLASAAIKNDCRVALHLLSFGDYIRGHTDTHSRRIEKEKDAILRLKPDIVAFSINSFMAEPLIKLAYSLRQSGIRTIGGGPHCTAEPELCAGSKAFNAVIAGEADDCFIDSIKSIMQDDYTPEWFFTHEQPKANYVCAKNIDILPFPAKHLFYAINRFEAEDYKIVSSRGCLLRCSFCSHSNPKTTSHYRRRSIGNVIMELEHAKKTYPVKSVYFLDDYFNSDKKWITELMEEYRRYIGLPFHAVCHPDKIDYEVASALKSGGCFAVRIGVQTLTEELKIKFGRKETNEKVFAAVNNLKRNDIKVEVDHIVNLPGDSPADSVKSIEFYNAVRPKSIKVYWFTPLPGTALFQQMKTEGRITSEQAEDIRNGKGFGKHSYLFYNQNFNNPDWLGIHFLLSYLPLLPKIFVMLLLKIKIYRVLKLHSFLIIVGVPRILNSGKWDKVGKEHRKRLLYSLLRKTH